MFVHDVFTQRVSHESATSTSWPFLGAANRMRHVERLIDDRKRSYRGAGR